MSNFITSVFFILLLSIIYILYKKCTFEHFIDKKYFGIYDIHTNFYKHYNGDNINIKSLKQVKGEHKKKSLNKTKPYYYKAKQPNIMNHKQKHNEIKEQKPQVHNLKEIKQDDTNNHPLQPQVQNTKEDDTNNHPLQTQVHNLKEIKQDDTNHLAIQSNGNNQNHNSDNIGELQEPCHKYNIGAKCVLDRNIPRLLRVGECRRDGRQRNNYEYNCEDLPHVRSCSQNHILRRCKVKDINKRNMGPSNEGVCQLNPSANDRVECIGIDLKRQSEDMSLINNLGRYFQKDLSDEMDSIIQYNERLDTNKQRILDQMHLI